MRLGRTITLDVDKLVLGIIAGFMVLVIMVFGVIAVIAWPIVSTMAGLQAECRPPMTTASSLSGSATAQSLPQATIDYLDGRGVRDLYQQHLAVYQEAEAKEGVPAVVMAALHYREAGMAEGRSILNGQPITGRTYRNVDNQLVGADANADAINAAQALKRLASGVYGIDVTAADLTEAQWGQAFLAYNRGYMYDWVNQTWRASPYVVNGLTDEYMDMHWPTSGEPSSTAGRQDGNKAGALTVMAYLGNAGTQSVSGACGSSSTAITGDIVSPMGDLATGDGMIISSLRGNRFRFGGRFHEGIDIHGHTSNDATVRSAAAGTVEIAGWHDDGGYGNYVQVNHGSFKTLYAHLDSIAVSVGQQVQPGTTLGIMGNTGNSFGAHLHFEWYEQNGPGAWESVDPRARLQENGIDLPLTADAGVDNW